MNNKFKIILWMMLSALPTLSYAQVKNIVTGEYSAVSKIITEKETLYPSDKILLVFDIDNTLLTSGTRIGGDIWYQWQTDKLPLKPDDSQKFLACMKIQSVCFTNLAPCSLPSHSYQQC